MYQDEELAEFQARLLDLLSRSLPPEQVVNSLKTEAVFWLYRNYVNSFQLGMIGVAAQLVKKWGRHGNEKKFKIQANLLFYPLFFDIILTKIN